MNLSVGLNKLQGKVLEKVRKRKQEAKDEQYWLPFNNLLISRTIATSAGFQNHLFIASH